jgi:L-gulono-1,4-lactone dehydrogenase
VFLGLSRLEPPLRSPRDRRDRFVNYAKTVRTQTLHWESPSTEEEISKSVSAAAAAGRRIRVVGAGHSWSGIAAPEDVAITLEHFTGIVARGDGWVRVRAGTRLRDLYRSLAAEGRALPVVASIAQQTVAGAIATGTHGSSLHHGNLSSLVLAARVVAGDGSIVEIAEGDERVDGIRVHLGALGVITEVTLRTTSSFHLAETIEKVPLADVAGRAEEIGRSAEYAKVWWMPRTPYALAFRYERTDEPMTRWPSPETQRLMENWLPRGILTPIYGYQRHRTGTVPAFNRVATRWLVKGRRVGPSTLMLTTPEPIRHYETEAAVPLAAGAEAFDRTVKLIEGSDVQANFILEFRFTQRDNGWMSSAYGRDVVHLGACTAIDAHKPAYFEPFWKEMRPLGARPHWAKEMDHEVGEVRSVYPMADRFLALRDELDPNRVFTNAFLNRVLGP